MHHLKRLSVVAPSRAEEEAYYLDLRGGSRDTSETDPSRMHRLVSLRDLEGGHGYIRLRPERQPHEISDSGTNYSSTRQLVFDKLIEDQLLDGPDPYIPAIKALREGVQELTANNQTQLSRFLTNVKRPQVLCNDQIQSDCKKVFRRSAPIQSAIQALESHMREIDGLMLKLGAESQAFNLLRHLSILRELSEKLCQKLKTQDTNAGNLSELLKPPTLVYGPKHEASILKPEIDAVFEIDPEGRFRLKNQDRASDTSGHAVFRPANTDIYMKQISLHAENSGRASSFPAVEHAVTCLSQRVIGGGAPPTRVIKVGEGDQVTAFALSHAIEGCTLWHILQHSLQTQESDSQNAPAPFRLNDANFSRHYLLDILSGPFDKKGDNVIVQGYEYVEVNGQQIPAQLPNQPALAEVPDNELGFYPPIVEHNGQVHINNHSLFFLMDQRNEDVHAEVRNHFAHLNPAKVLLEWMQDLFRARQDIQRLIDEGVFTGTDLERLHFPIRLPVMCVETLHQNLEIVKAKCAARGQLTHKDMLSAVHPEMAEYYEAQLERRIDPAAIQLGGVLDVFDRIYNRSGQFSSVNDVLPEKVGDLLDTAKPDNREGALEDDVVTLEVALQELVQSIDLSRMGIRDQEDVLAILSGFNLDNDTVLMFMENQSFSTLVTPSRATDFDLRNTDYALNLQMETKLLNWFIRQTSVEFLISNFESCVDRNFESLNPEIQTYILNAIQIQAVQVATLNAFLSRLEINNLRAEVLEKCLQLIIAIDPSDGRTFNNLWVLDNTYLGNYARAAQQKGEDLKQLTIVGNRLVTHIGVAEVLARYPKCHITFVGNTLQFSPEDFSFNAQLKAIDSYENSRSRQGVEALSDALPRDVSGASRSPYTSVELFMADYRMVMSANQHTAETIRVSPTLAKALITVAHRFAESTIEEIESAQKKRFLKEMLYAAVDASPDDSDIRIKAYTILLKADALDEDAMCRFFDVSVEVLQLANLTGFTDAHLDAILKKCPHLREIRISFCRELSNAALEKLLRVTKHLEYLDIWGMPQLSSEGFQHISRLTNLTTLRIRGFLQESQPAPLSATDVQAIAKNCFRLQTVELFYCPQIEAEDIRDLLKNCPDLTTLRFPKCERITNRVFTYLLDADRKYRRIWGGGCSINVWELTPLQRARLTRWMERPDRDFSFD